MVSRLANWMTDFFIGEKIIKESDKEIYEYCFELLLFGCMNLILMILIAVYCDRFFESIFWLLVFIPLRSLMGGFHAANYIKCFFMTMMCYIIFIASLKIQSTIQFFMSLFFILFSVIAVFLFAPLEDKNKPLSVDEKISLKKRSRKAVLVFSVLNLLGVCLFFGNSIVFSSVMGEMVASFSLVLGKGKEWIIMRRD